MKKTNKKCHFCGNASFEEKNVKYTYSLNDKYLFVDDVPCKECTYCGEQYFKANVLKAIEKEFNEIHTRGKIVAKEIRVPVEQYMAIASV